MLTGFKWCIPLKTKTADEVVTAYKNHIACPFGGSVKILMDNRTEFKNKLFEEVVAKLGMEMSIHLPPYRPQSNGKIEGFHRFLKACIAKNINHGLEWDELTPMATACYNYFPNCSAQESAFFLMFGKDPVNKLNQMLHEARRYFHDDNRIPDLEALKNIYQLVAQQLLNSRKCYMKKHYNQKPVEYPVKLGDLILMVNHIAKAFKPKYKKGTYRVVKVHGNQVDIWDFRGNISTVHITDVKKTTLTHEVADDYLQLCNEGRFTKKCVPRGYIPDLNWATIHNNLDHPIKPVKQEEDPRETTVTPAAPTEVEGPPSSHLRSKTKQQSTTIKQEQPEYNPASLDPPKCNQAKFEVNQVEVDPRNRSSLVHYALTLLGVGKTKPALNGHLKEESTKSIKYKKIVYVLCIETCEFWPFSCKPCPLRFKPVLVSGKILKNLKFPTFCTNSTHFYYEFLKDFYIFRILGPSGLLWYQWIQDSSSTH